MARWIVLGDVRSASLGEVLARSVEKRARLAAALGGRRVSRCNPDGQAPEPACAPDSN